MTTLASLALAVFVAAAPRTDTTLAVPAGTRLELENFSGGIVVDTWARNAVRVRAEHSRRTQVELERDGDVLTVSASGAMGMPASVEYELTVPAWMALHLSGVDTDITVRGSKGEVEAETVKGRVSIEGGSGRVSASSIEGSVHVELASGVIEASSVNAGVWVNGVTGAIEASTVNGPVVLTSVKSPRVEASSVNGAVLLNGPLAAAGDYHLSSHNGEVIAGLAEGADVTVHVSTYEGEFSAGFPVRLEEGRRKSKRFRFTLGDGSATLELESFLGEIRVNRPAVVEREAEALRAESQKEEE